MCRIKASDSVLIGKIDFIILHCTMNEHTFYNISTYIIAKDFYGICNVCKNVCVV